MARRFTRGARFVRPAPRTKMWIGAGVGETSLAGSTKVFVGSYSAGALALRPFTILRTHLECIYGSDQLVATENPFGTLGIIVVTDTAAAVGVTAIPDPGGTGGDPDADWFVYQPMAMRFAFLSSVGFNGDDWAHYAIDSKAMRKVGIDDDAVTMFSQESTVGGTVLTTGRQLIQLH